MLGGVPGVTPGKVLVIGGGIVGTQAAKMAAGLGALVTILDVSLPRLRYLSDVMPANVVTEFSNEYNIRRHIKPMISLSALCFCQVPKRQTSSPGKC